jgi:medium-chain acyl-[acyl-carrier-protein] hydrolase
VSAGDGRYVVVPLPKPAAPLRLVCFPYAGGGASGYVAWARSLADHPVELCALQLPGRENRLAETPLRDAAVLVEAVLEALRPRLDRRFAFFGHSMGALIAYEVTRRLAASGGPLPERLFVSSARPPHVAAPAEQLHELDDTAFVDALDRKYAGIPSAVRENRELLGLVLPALRADIALLETYAHRPGAAFTTPISAFGGSDDTLFGPALLERWRELTHADFAQAQFPGGHFYLHEARVAVLDAILRQLA